MRIITGKYKGRHFTIPSTFKARPTTDFAKENLFNVLRGFIDFEETHALDLFGGTGSISLELLSRGCPRVVTVELDRKHYAFIEKCRDILHDEAWIVYRTDALRFIEKSEGEYDLIFADPPYTLPELPTIPERIFQSSLLGKKGLFVLEHGKNYNFDSHPNFVAHRAYGSVNFSFFKKNKQEGEK